MTFDFGECSLDTEARTLRCGGATMPLSGKAFELLQLLLRERPRPLKKEELMERLWPDTFVAEANLASLIKEIRAAIGDDARESRFIRTVHRFGYAFIADVKERESDAAPIAAVAVLPFAVRPVSEEGELIGESVVEALTIALGRVSGLRVTPRATALRYSAAEFDAARLQRELRVDAAISGSVTSRAGQHTISVELIDVKRDSQLWGERFLYEGDTEQKIARAVVAQLRASTAQEKSRRRYSLEHEAYNFYLRGRHHWNRRTPEGIERAIEFFERSIAADADFALAYAGLADCYIALASRDLQAPESLFPRAESAARKALQLDPELAEAHASLGAISEIFRWDWSAAERSFVESLRLDPNYVTGRMWYALGLTHQRRFEEARRQFDIASESDPLSFLLNAQRGAGRYLARRFPEAAAECQKAVEINPYHEPAHFILGLIQQQLGDFGAARAELERAHTISKGEPHVEAALGALAAMERNASEAMARLDALRRLAEHRHVSAVHYATIYAALGDADAAFNALDEAVRLRSGWLVYLGTEPRFDALRNDARFSKLLARTGQSD